MKLRTAAVSLALFLLPPALLPAQAPAGLQPEQVRALAQRAFDQFQPKALAVAVLQDGQLLTEVAFGERAPGKAATPATLFNIASCSKAFTAALVAQFVAEGKLDWNDRVVDRLPEFRMQDPWITAHMTVADLLSHRCGMLTFEGDLLWYGSDYTDQQVLQRLERLPIPQRFREQFGYQNLMYMVAGLLLERVSGQSWETLLEHRLLRPLGMQATRPCAQLLPEGAEIALPYIDGVEVQDHHFVACKPAAAIYSSVHDLSAWMAMLLAGGKGHGQQLLDGAALAEMWKPHVQMGAASGADPRDLRAYGMGWFLYLHDGHKLVEHDGGMPGFLSKVSLLPAQKFGFAVLNNNNDGVLNEAVKAALLAARAGGDGNAQIDRLAAVGKRLAARHRQEVQRREAQRRQGTQPSLPLDAYVGRYEDAIYGPAEVTLVDGALQVALLPSKSRLFGAMQHWHFDVFRIDFPDRFLPFALFAFELGSDGKVQGFRIDCPIADFDFGALDFRRQPAKAQ